VELIFRSRPSGFVDLNRVILTCNFHGGNSGEKSIKLICNCYLCFFNTFAYSLLRLFGRNCYVKVTLPSSVMAMNSQQHRLLCFIHFNLLHYLQFIIQSSVPSNKFRYQSRLPGQYTCSQCLLCTQMDFLHF